MTTYIIRAGLVIGIPGIFPVGRRTEGVTLHLGEGKHGDEELLPN